ncbi:hypothetical protein K3495_g8399 [Podosphaera aphanis]|nr:hypothetical protein K3495_g8399 [Podosphaera aphanis]
MLDQLSPAAPARVRVVLLPTGQIKRARFLRFVERLQPEHIVRLGDVSPDGRPHRNMFSPLAFQKGMIVYDLITFFPSDSHLALSPFELHQEPLVIIAIADGAELETMLDNGNPSVQGAIRGLEKNLKCLRDQYSKALVHRVLLFDHLPNNLGINLPDDIVTVPPPEMCKRTTLKTIMCDISSKLLADMTILARSFQELKAIDSPSVSNCARDHSVDSVNGQFDDIPGKIIEQKKPGNRRNSIHARNTDRNAARISMPATSSATGTETTKVSTRSTSSVYGAFNPSNLHENGDSSPTSESSNHRKFSLDHTISGRDKPQDRNSLHGFGSGTISERSRNKLKGRKSIVIGSIYMLAGRWTDAIKELAEGVSIAKSHLDHLWHAKALDNILVNMLMQAWCGLGFQIPQICYISEKVTSALPFQDEKSSNLNWLTSLQNLTTLLPELIDKILNLYTRAANNTRDWLTQLPFSESVIRFSKLLSAIHLNGGTLNAEILQFAVLGTPSCSTPNINIPRLNIRPTRSEILAVILRAFPTAPSDSLSVIDRTTILCGIASVLSTLGYRRKKALVIRELVSYLIHGLVQARIKGAAEIGVHPNAGLLSLKPSIEEAPGASVLDLREGDVGAGIGAFLGLLGQSYGVVSSQGNYNHGPVDSDENIISRILENASIRAFGDQKIKMDVLRSCISISEALPDLRGVLKFTSDFLRTAGCGVAPGPRSHDASPSIGHAEQIKLAANISRIAAKNLADKSFEAEYWDEFLLRGIEVDTPPSRKIPIPHNRSELPGASSEKVSAATNPFIYNPFLRPHQNNTDNCLLVADEVVTFKITLQNPFEFDIEIESLRLETSGIEFDSASLKAVVGPYRTQILNILGTPKTSGQLRITGCFLKIFGCRDRRFPIFKDPWSPQRESKIRTIGVADLFKTKEITPAHSLANNSPFNSTIIPPKPDVLTLNVISKQPVVIVKNTTLTQYALMVLEGEQKTFSVTLQNTSSHTSVDLLLFSFKDSIQEKIQTELNNRDSEPAEQYEYELMLTCKPSLRWKSKDGAGLLIPPGGIATHEIEVFGKPGLTHAVIQIDYASLGVPVDNFEEKFYTRQISLPITILANSSVEVTKFDIIPLSNDAPHFLLEKSCMATDRQSSLESFDSSDYCLVLLDLRNAWSSNVMVCLNTTHGAKIEEEISSGHTSRIMIPIKRIFLEDAYAMIPSLDPSRQRQFVVSDGKITADSERAKRRAFWYREELLKVIQGTWSSKSISRRCGEINLRSISLDPLMIDAMTLSDLAIDLSLNSHQDKIAEQFIDTFLQLKVRIINRTLKPISGILRLQPSICNQPLTQISDISKRLVVNGLLQQSLPEVSAKSEIEISLDLIVLARGFYEINASIEETRIQTPDECISAKNTNGRPRASTLAMINALFSIKERRIWHSRKPLLIIGRDVNTADDNE